MHFNSIAVLLCYQACQFFSEADHYQLGCLKYSTAPQIEVLNADLEGVKTTEKLHSSGFTGSGVCL